MSQDFTEELFTPVRIVWPPPGLEGHQGALVRAAGKLGFGGSLVALPVLLSVSVQQPFFSPGLFPGAWVASGVTALLGLLVVASGLVGLFGFFSNARKSALLGIDLETALQVGADHDGAMGSLIQGTRSFRALEERDRVRAVHARIWASLLFLSSALWISVGWVLALSLAGRGLLGPGGVWVLSLGPAAVTMSAGIVAKAIEGSALNRAIGPLFWSRWKTAGLREAAEIWGEELGRFRAKRGERAVPGRGTLLAGALSVLALGASVLIPAAGFTAATAVGPALANMAVPKFSATMRKAGETEALRYLRLTSDPSISPVAAGEALHVLVGMDGNVQNLEEMKTPVRSYETGFFPEGTEALLGLRPHEWPSKLIPGAFEGLTAEEEASLREIAGHPALLEFETLAYAEGVDYLGAAYVLPFPPEMTTLTFPIPRLSRIREGGYSMVAKAAYQALEGQSEEAERTLRVLLSAGVLMAEESTTLIGSLIGYVLAANGADALEALWHAEGRPEEAEALQRVRIAARRASELAQQGTFRTGIETALEGMTQQVLSEDVIRGLRWEFLFTLTGLSPCINPNQVLFGPGPAFSDFMDSAREGLVRYPSEEEYFELFKRGWRSPRASPSTLGKWVNATMGSGAGKCAEMLTAGLF